MIQKITLEIQNDTGVEFEETTKWDCPKESEYFINSRHRIEKSDRFSSCYHYVLTPKIDAELEEAKKLIGKWIKCKGDNFAFEVEEVYRDKEDNFIKVYNKTLGTYFVSETDPFPLPVWRCCAEDKHLLQPRKAYFVRSKKKDVWLLDTYDPVRGWEEVNHENKYEWLDEGEK